MKTTITVPDNLNELSVGQYQKYLELTEGIEGEFLNQRTVEVLCGIPFEKVTYLKHKDVKEIAEGLTKMLNGEAEFRHRFKIKSQEFGFIPSLEDMSSGEFADLCAYIKDTKNMHKAMAVMFRPITKRIGDKYDIFPYNGSKEFGDLMKFMPLGIALGAMVFFYNLANDLVNATQHSIKQEAVEMILAEHPLLEKSGVSTKTSTPLLKAMLQNLRKSAGSTSTPA